MDSAQLLSAMISSVSRTKSFVLWETNCLARHALSMFGESLGNGQLRRKASGLIFSTRWIRSIKIHSRARPKIPKWSRMMIGHYKLRSVMLESTVKWTWLGSSFSWSFTSVYICSMIPWQDDQPFTGAGGVGNKHSMQVRHFQVPPWCKMMIDDVSVCWEQIITDPFLTTASFLPISWRFIFPTICPILFHHFSRSSMDFIRSTRRWRSDILQLPGWKLPSPALKKSMDFPIFAMAIWAICGHLCTWIAVSRIIPL